MLAEPIAPSGYLWTSRNRPAEHCISCNPVPSHIPGWTAVPLYTADAFEARIAALEAMLTEARAGIVEWANYASEHDRGKYDLAGELAAIDAVLAGKTTTEGG